MNFSAKSTRFEHIALAAIMFAAALLRLWHVGLAPGSGALNLDEAYSAYEAYSLIHYGVDSHGYGFPVYLMACGSGMNALQTYILIPFIAVLGNTPLAVRLPSALFGVATVFFFYAFAKRCRGIHFALIATAFFAILPWHITASRWALESNWLPGMLLLALLLVSKAVDDSKWLIPCAATFGLSLYCYSASWIVMPVLMLATLRYWYVHAAEPTSKLLWVSLAVFALFAAPLAAFILVNVGAINELRLPLLSIPKLTVFRSSEVGLAGIPKNLVSLIKMLATQNDGLKWSSNPGYGFYYYVSIPFAFAGIYFMLSKKHRATATEPSSPELLVFAQLICGMLLGLVVEANCNRINIIHIPIAYCIALGIWETIQLIHIKSPKLHRPAAIMVAAIYLVCGISFTVSYFTTYNNTMYSVFQGGLKEALKDSMSSGTTHITGAHFPQVLFYSAYPAPRFANEVEWVDPTSAYLRPTVFGNYDFRSFAGGAPVPGDKYLCRTNDKAASDWFKHNNMHVEQFGTFLVGSIDDQGTRQ